MAPRLTRQQTKLHKSSEEITSHYNVCFQHQSLENTSPPSSSSFDYLIYPHKFLKTKTQMGPHILPKGQEQSPWVPEMKASPHSVTRPHEAMPAFLGRQAQGKASPSRTREATREPRCWSVPRPAQHMTDGVFLQN